jgi:hypothetical protein
VDPLGQGRGTHARFRRARPYIPERLRSCRVSQAFTYDRSMPCSVRADYTPRAPRFTGHASTDVVSRRWSCSSQVSLRADERRLAQRDPRNVRPTSANQSFQRRGPGAVRRSALPWLSPHPHRWNAWFTPRAPRKPSSIAIRVDSRHSTESRLGATSDAPLSSPCVRELGFRPALAAPATEIALTRGP